MLEKIPHSKQATREERNFHHLLEQVEDLQQKVEAQKNIGQNYILQHQQKIRPLLEKLQALNLIQVRSLHFNYQKEAYPKRLQNRLSDLIQERIKGMLALFDYEGEAQDELRDIWQQQGDELLSDPEPFPILSETSKQEKQQGKGKKKKAQSPEVLKTAHQAKVQLNQMSKSRRAVYTSLVKQLHPDREPDEQMQLEKTKAIQKVTAAYQEKDMLGLLRLQAEHLESNCAQTELKHYSRILRQQLEELEMEYQSLLQSNRNCSFPHEKAMEKFFKTEGRKLKKHIKQEELLLKQVFQQPEVLLELLKQG
ncbi:MAG: hypothetical protein ACEPOZ_21625 [Marinifilaceae bacterium]